MTSPTSRKNRSRLAIWIAGGDLLGHRVEMVVGNLARLAMAGAVGWLIVIVLSVALFVSEQNFELWFASVTAVIYDVLGFSGKLIEIAVNGRTFQVQAGELAGHVWSAWRNEHTTLSGAIGESWAAMRWAWIGASISTIPAYVGGFQLYLRIGEKQKADEFIRGQKIVEADYLSEYVEKFDTPSPIKIGNVPIPLRLLARNFLFAGSMGTGKSQAISPIMEQARGWGKKMVVYDKTGEFTQKFYRPGVDVILNPVDSRCADWSIFNDVRKKTDFALVAKFFVPINRKASEQTWDNASRVLLADLIRIARETGKTMAWVEKIATRGKREEIHELLQRYDATSTGVINPENERGTESVRLTITTAPAIQYFPLFNSAGEFSLRDFVTAPGDGCVFITSSSTDHDMVKPFASAWIELALTELMSQAPTTDIRCMFFLDELASLERIPSLETALTEARKYGITTLAGLQSSSQLVELYGREMAQVFLDNLQTQLILRAGGNATAKELSEMLGSEDVVEIVESQSFGSESNRDGVNISGQRKERPLVTASQIRTLPDLTGWLKISADYPITEVKTEYRSWPNKEPGLIYREGIMLSPINNGVGGDFADKPRESDNSAEEEHERASETDTSTASEKSAFERENERYVDDLGIGM